MGELMCQFHKDRVAVGTFDSVPLCEECFKYSVEGD